MNLKRTLKKPQKREMNNIVEIILLSYNSLTRKKNLFTLYNSKFKVFVALCSLSLMFIAQ